MSVGTTTKKKAIKSCATRSTENFESDLKSTLLSDFPQLKQCDKIDMRMLWAEDGQIRYRINGWTVSRNFETASRIIFSKFIIAWRDKKGIQYKVLSKK